MQINKFQESNGVSEGAICSCTDGPLELESDWIEEKEDVEDFLQDMDSYWTDVSYRIIISRMVAETVMKETAKEVFEEAAGMVASKELQMAQLKEELRLQCQACDESNASNAILHDLILEQQIQNEVQLLVMKESILRLQESREGGIGNHNAEDVRLIEKFKEFSLLRQELEGIHKSLSGIEFGHLSSEGTLDVDHPVRRILTTHVSAPSSLWEGNGLLEESKLEMPENFESSQLKHMTTEDLYLHYKMEITQMRREHESTVQRMTEDYFTLKRELLKERELKERRSHLPFKRDMELDLLKKKILDVISKLEQNLPEIFGYYGIYLDSLHSENLGLKDMLSSKEREIEHLSFKVSDAEEKLSGISCDEKNLHELEDARAEASIREEVSQVILKELISNLHGDDEEADMKFAIMQEIVASIYQEALHKVVVDVKHKLLDVSDVESSLVQGISEVVYEESLKDMIVELRNSGLRSFQADERFRFLECEVSGMKKALEAGDQENKRLKQEITILELLAEENEKSLLDLVTELEKEKRQVALANLEVIKLQNSKAVQEAVASQRNNELEKLKKRSDVLSFQISVYEDKISNLTEKLDQEAARVRAVTEEKERITRSSEAKDIEQRKRVASLVPPINELSKLFNDFERRVAERVKWNNLRLEGSTFQVHSLIKKANIVRRTGLLYKQRLEKRCGDLQKAEAEVDLLGDEVDALSNLLQKVYIGLDHYSPVLQHYSGMMEILKLVRMELSGDSVRTMCRTP